LVFRQKSIVLVNKSADRDPGRSTGSITVRSYSMSIYSAGDRTPFTYVITHIPSGKKYYGSRYKKGCVPDDLWSNYFTSSAKIKSLIETDGLNSFLVKIRKIFNSVEKCRDWESRFLHKINARENSDWLNEHNGESSFFNISKASDITRQRMSKVRLGKPKSESMKLNAMWYYELQFDNGSIEYIKGKVNVLLRLGRTDWETIRVKIKHKNGYIAKDNVTIKRMPKYFKP